MINRLYGVNLILDNVFSTILNVAFGWFQAKNIKQNRGVSDTMNKNKMAKARTRLVFVINLN